MKCWNCDGAGIITDINRIVGRRIREERERKELEQSDLAACIGLERSVISRIESGERECTPMELSLICRRLGVDADILLIERGGSHEN